MYDFKKKVKNYCHLDNFYWLTKVINLLTISLILSIFIFCNIYSEKKLESNSEIKLNKEIKNGIWIFDIEKNVWVLTKFSFFLIIFSVIVLFFQITLTIISIKHTNYIKLFLLTNILLIFTSIMVLIHALFFNANLITNIRQIWLVFEDGRTKFSFIAIIFIIFTIGLFGCILIFYFFDIFLNLKLRKKVNIYVMNKNYHNQNYKQK